MKCRCVLGVFVFLCLAATGLAQVAISTQAGLIHHHVGQVMVDGQPVPFDSHRFVQLDPAQVLATDDGQAEVLLSPHSIFRLGPNSRVKLLSDDIIHPKLELLRSSTVIDSSRGAPEAIVSLVSGSSLVDIRSGGLYRLDAPLDQALVLRVFRGKATTHDDGCEWRLKSRQAVRLDSSAIGVYAFDADTPDALDEWNRERGVRIAWLNRLSSGPGRQFVDGLRNIGRHLGNARSNLRKGIHRGRQFPTSARRRPRSQSRSASGSN